MVWEGYGLEACTCLPPCLPPPLPTLPVATCVSQDVYPHICGEHGPVGMCKGRCGKFPVLCPS